MQVLSPKDRQNDEYGALHASGIHCTGRIVLNVWRILRSELKLNIYTFESCVAAVLQLRTPHVQPHVLTHWFNGGPAGGVVPTCVIAMLVQPHAPYISITLVQSRIALPDLCMAQDHRGYAGSNDIPPTCTMAMLLQRHFHRQSWHCLGPASTPPSSFNTWLNVQRPPVLFACPYL